MQLASLFLTTWRRLATVAVTLLCFTSCGDNSNKPRCASDTPLHAGGGSLGTLPRGEDCLPCLPGPEGDRKCADAYGYSGMRPQVTYCGQPPPGQHGDARLCRRLFCDVEPRCEVGKGMCLGGGVPFICRAGCACAQCQTDAECQAEYGPEARCGDPHCGLCCGPGTPSAFQDCNYCL